MKRKQIKNRINKEVPPLLFSIIVVFFILGMLVFAISRKITEEMSSSAIHNLNESLVLIKGTIEAILVKESEFQKLIAQEIATLDELEEFVKQNRVDIAALTMPKEKAEEVANMLVNLGINAIWNFAHLDLELPEHVVVENVHLSDSLMQLSYNIANQRKLKKRKDKK